MPHACMQAFDDCIQSRKKRSVSGIYYPYIFITSVDPLDWKDYGRGSIIKTVICHKHLGNGSIILCHNGAKYTAEAPDTMIKTLKKQGYEFVPASEVIYRENATWITRDSRSGISGDYEY